MTRRCKWVLLVILVVCRESVADNSGTRPPLNPKNASDQPHRIDISAHDWGENLKQFYVIIRARDPKIPLEVASGYLTICEGNKFVSGCEVKPDPDKGAIRFQFRVAPAYLDKSKFSFTVATATAHDRKQLPSGGGWAIYEFALKDFMPVTAAPSREQLPITSSTGVVVTKTKLSFDPKTCTEGKGGFGWALGSVSVTILGQQDGKCIFDYQWEVEGAGNYQVYRVRVPVGSGPVVIEAEDRQVDQEHHWSSVYTSFTAEQAELVRRMQFAWFEVPVGKEFARYQEFRAGDEAPPVGRGDTVTLRVLVFLDEKFTELAGVKLQRQSVTTRVGDGGPWQWAQSVAEGMRPYEVRRVQVPAKVAGPARDWLPGNVDGSTVCAEVQVIAVERK